MIKRIISLLLGCLLAFILVEFSLRIIGHIAEKKPKVEEIKKSPNEFTILTLGNSYTAGTGAPKGKSYPDYLRKLLNKERNKKYRVINYGRGSANTSYVLENLPLWLKKNKPDLVFIMTGEPNGWNKYGYINFIKNKYNVSYLDIFLDKIRFFKTYRLLELLVNRNESFKSSFYEYSNTFSHIKKTDIKLLAYTWLGHLQWGSLYSVNELTAAQADEAIESLEKLIAVEKNHLARQTLALLYFVQRKDYAKFYIHSMESMNQSPYFSFDLWRTLEISKSSEVLNTYQKTKILKKKLNSLKRELPIEEVEAWIKSKDLSRYKFKDREEIISFLKKLIYLSPGDAVNVHRFFENAWAADDAIDIFEYIIKLNPLSPVFDYAQFANWIIGHNPSKKDRIEKIFKQIKEKIGVSELDYIYQENIHEKEWILSDLEKMIQLIQNSGAKIVIQTYPPKRNESIRLADETLRNWYKERKSKDSIVFMDVTKMLEEKFSKRNGGDKYYSMQFGDRDDHQNEIGNEVIARLMLDYVDK